MSNPTTKHHPLGEALARRWESELGNHHVGSQVFHRHARPRPCVEMDESDTHRWLVAWCFFLAVMFSRSTPWKIDMEPTNHPFGKENDLPSLHDYVPCQSSGVYTSIHTLGSMEGMVDPWIRGSKIPVWVRPFVWNIIYACMYLDCI